MDTISGTFGWVPLIGGLLLGAVLLFALWSNHKKSSRRDIERTEEATAELKAQLDREDKTR